LDRVFDIFHSGLSKYSALRLKVKDHRITKHANETALRRFLVWDWVKHLQSGVLLGLLFGITMAMLLVSRTSLPNLPPMLVKAGALAVVSIILWATRIIPEYLTALLFFVLAMVFAVAPPSVVFSGFESDALWLIFAGLVVGLAIKLTGLGERIAHSIARNVRRQYLGLIATVVLICLVLSFLMPSSLGRAVLIVPIILELAEQVGFAEGTKGRTGLVLAAAFANSIPAFAILPANIPNMVLLAGAESIYHLPIQYGEYLALHFPVVGMVNAIAITLLITLFFSEHPKPANRATVGKKPLSTNEFKLVIILAISLGLWLTDFAHHISPAWIGLAAAIVCLLPGFGLLPPRAINEQLNYGSQFFVAGIMGVGSMVSHSGLGHILAHTILSVLPLQPGHSFKNFTSLSLTSMLVGMVTTLPGVPAVLTPLAGELAKATGLPIKTVLMTQVLGFATVLLPYQAPPLVVAIQLGGVRLSAAVKVSVSLALISLLVLIPLDYLWWRVLGWL
jgi:anion transporter